MKKVKILLSTVAVFAVVGGALAYKAASPSQLVYVHDPNDARVSACTKQVFKATLTTNPDPIDITRASIGFTTAACPVVTIYKGQ